MENYTVWATLLSPIISVIAIIVALIIARSSSKDAKTQITAIRHLLDVFVAANNLDIVEAKRKYQQLLVEINRKIEDAQMEVDIVSPFFVGGAKLTKLRKFKKKLNKKHILINYSTNVER